MEGTVHRRLQSPVSPFAFEGKPVRVIEDDKGNPLFVAKDVAEILGYKEPGLAVRTHCKGGVKHTLPTNGGPQTLTLIPESDVYRLIIRSKLPAAEKFEKWIMEEVLPTIRKTGKYAMPGSEQVPVVPAQMNEIEYKYYIGGVY